MNSTIEKNNLFKGECDRFRCVSISSKIEARNEDNFLSTLLASLVKWKEDKIRAVWMQVYLEDSHWITNLIKNGFIYHHCQPNYVTLVCWLPESEPNNLPCYAHNILGVGGFVVNEANELLVVKERSHAIPFWKLPGGYVELGEDLSQAALREVKEETGIETEFESLLAFRHVHGATYGCSDMYFVIVLKPKSQHITMCKNELADCRWMKLKVYLTHSEVTETSKFIARCYVEAKEKELRMSLVYQQLQLTRVRDISDKKHQQLVYFLDANESNNPQKNERHKTDA